jgi:hypothetical protein
MKNHTFRTALQRKLCLPIINNTIDYKCLCGATLNPYSDNCLGCKVNDKSKSSNGIWNEIIKVFQRILPFVGMIDVGTQIECEAHNIVPSLPRLQPFDLSIRLDHSLDSGQWKTPYNRIGFNVRIVYSTTPSSSSASEAAKYNEMDLHWRDGERMKFARLGCKFRRNSGQSFCSVPDSGVFWPGMFTDVLSHIGRFERPPCKAGLICSERAYLSFLSLRTSNRSRYRGSLSWVAFKLKKKMTKTETALPELWVSFRVLTEFGPMSDRNRDRNLQPSCSPERRYKSDHSPHYSTRWCHWWDYSFKSSIHTHGRWPLWRFWVAILLLHWQCQHTPAPLIPTWQAKRNESGQTCYYITTVHRITYSAWLTRNGKLLTPHVALMDHILINSQACGQTRTWV